LGGVPRDIEVVEHFDDACGREVTEVALFCSFLKTLGIIQEVGEKWSRTESVNRKFEVENYFNLKFQAGELPGRQPAPFRFS
jgi:hypothetical protein